MQVQGATLGVHGVCRVRNVTTNEAGTWANVELLEPEAENKTGSNANVQLGGIRASLKIQQGTRPPSENALVSIRSAILNKPIKEHQGKDTAFWTVTIFQWSEIGVATLAQAPTNGGAVTAKPKVTRPVLDDGDSPEWGDDDVPF